MPERHDVHEPVEQASEERARPTALRTHSTYLAVPDAFGDATAGPSHACCLSADHHGAVQVVEVVGRLDWATVERFRDLLIDCPDRAVIVDLSAARLDAAGTGAVLSATARARKRDQQLVFVVCDPVELEALASAGLEVMVPVVASVGEALAWIGVDRDAAVAAT